MQKAPIKIILSYLSKGFNQSEIAKKLKVTRQCISLNLKNCDPDFKKNHFDKHPITVNLRLKISREQYLAKKRKWQKTYRTKLKTKKS